jgi:hypothetical protein
MKGEEGFMNVEGAAVNSSNGTHVITIKAPADPECKRDQQKSG